MKTPNRGNLHILLVLISVSYLSTLTEAHSLPVFGIISRCPIDRIQVASDSAIDTSWFWSASKTCPIWQFNSTLGLFENHYDLRGIKPTPGFSPGFRFKFVSPGENTGVPPSDLNYLQRPQTYFEITFWPLIHLAEAQNIRSPSSTETNLWRQWEYTDSSLMMIPAYFNVNDNNHGWFISTYSCKL